MSSDKVAEATGKQQESPTAMHRGGAPLHGGLIVAGVLAKQGVEEIFTLCGGHISPILVGCEELGIKVIGCRDERSAVFAADAAARLTGRCGVVVVTAGPGVTNALTALKNAQLAQSPVVLLGGATAMLLKGRGALQDIDQMSLVASAVKLRKRCTSVAAIAPTVERAMQVARKGVPGPVFVELPVDVLYAEDTVRKMMVGETGGGKDKSLGGRALANYIRYYLWKTFHRPFTWAAFRGADQRAINALSFQGASAALGRSKTLLRRAKRPMLVIGSQALTGLRDASALRKAVEALGVPTWLAGGARGLLGRNHDLQFRHARGKSIRQADLLVLCGVPFDFRLKYGLGGARGGSVVAANLSANELALNRRPDVALQMHPADFLVALAKDAPTNSSWNTWVDEIRARESARDQEIAATSKPAVSPVDAVHFFLRLEEQLPENAILVLDGGDFVGTAAYILRPRGPHAWLDPGVFGTLGVGGGFAVGASAVRKDAEVWLIYGDGSSAFSLAEIDTCVRHGFAPIIVVGTDASWEQIARDQTALLGAPTGTTLLRTAYEVVAKGYGGVGLEITEGAQVDRILEVARARSKEGKPVLINVQLGKSKFREGSISM